MECKYCGAENDDNAVFCESCGFKLAPSEAASASLLAPTIEYTPVRAARAFKDAITLIVGPGEFMTKKREENPALRSVMVNYVAVLAIIPLAAGILGEVIFFGLSPYLGLIVADALEVYALDIAAVAIAGVVIWKLAAFFGTETNQAKATMLSAFVATPFFVLAAIEIVPYITALSYFGLLYGIYILYQGLPTLLGTPHKKAVIFTLSAFGILALVALSIAALQYLIAVALVSA